MPEDILALGSVGKKFVDKVKLRGALIDVSFQVEGMNEDITEPYYWHVNFPYYLGKGYTSLKVEDYHYFSENSQFGTSIRQIKGGSIKAFQENLAQLVQLIKVHLMPLLKEVKQADFYSSWFRQITDNDELVQKELEKPSGKRDEKGLKKWRAERNEAINHVKDKWVTEVDGGRLWQINKSASEQGLDFALLPQLFFGISLDDPFQKSRSLKEQLDEDVYPIEISLQAKEQVARFMYRFYTWLPTAVKETQMTFRIKVSALKQFYAQIQMYIKFMKPLLIEIAKKSEGFSKQDFYRDFESESPEFVNLFDVSYSFVRILGVKEFKRKFKYKIEDLEFAKFGFFVEGRSVVGGAYAGKSGFIREVKDGGETYVFYPCEKKDVKREEFLKIKPVEIYRNDLIHFSVMELTFSQKRRSEIMSTPQGVQQVPYMVNDIGYNGYCWNIFEVASYREQLKIDDLALLGTFVEEVSVVRDDLLKYVDELDVGGKEEMVKPVSKKAEKEGAVDYSFVLGPIKGLAELFSPLVPRFSFGGGKKVKKAPAGGEDKFLVEKLSIVEDTWKCYNLFKKSHGYLTF